MFSKFSVLSKIYKFLNFQDNGLLRISRYITPTRRCSSKIIPCECGTNIVFRPEIINYISRSSYNMIKYKDKRYLKLTRYLSSKDSKEEDKENSTDNNETKGEECKIKSLRRPKRKGSKKAKVNCKRCKSISLRNIARFGNDIQTRHNAKPSHSTEIFPSKSEDMLINNIKDISRIQFPPNNIYIEFMESHSLKDIELTKTPTEQRISSANVKQSGGEIANAQNAQVLKNATKKVRGKIENLTNTPQGEKVELPISKLLKNTPSPKVECLSPQYTSIATSTIGESKNQATVLFKTTNAMLNKSSSGTIDASKNNGVQSDCENTAHNKTDEKIRIFPEKFSFQSTNCPKNMFGEYMSAEKLKLKSSTTFKTNKLTKPNSSGIPKIRAGGNHEGGDGYKTPDKQIPTEPPKDSASRFWRTFVLTTLPFMLGFTVYIFTSTEEALEMLKKLYLTTTDEGHFTFKVLPAYYENYSVSDSEQTENAEYKSLKDDSEETEKEELKANENEKRKI